MFVSIFVLTLVMFAPLSTVHAQVACDGKTANDVPACQSVDVNALGFKIPSLADLLTFAIRGFFAIAGIAALFYMLIGAFGWVTSGGDKDSIGAARDRIQAALVGMILIVAVLALIWTLEQVIFKRRICLGLSCPVTLPGLIETSKGQEYCCACVVETSTTPDHIGRLSGTVINAFTHKCLPDGTASQVVANP
ncbi:hypothetical protein BH09PAT2_BH09PAT2_01890 [soil metagenome]